MSRFPRCIRAFPTFHSGSNMQDACLEIFHLAESALVCYRPAALGGRESKKPKIQTRGRDKEEGFAVGRRLVFPPGVRPGGQGWKGLLQVVQEMAGGTELTCGRSDPAIPARGSPPSRLPRSARAPGTPCTRTAPRMGRMQPWKPGARSAPRGTRRPSVAPSWLWRFWFSLPFFCPLPLVPEMWFRPLTDAGCVWEFCSDRMDRPCQSPAPRNRPVGPTPRIHRHRA